MPYNTHKSNIMRSKSSGALNLLKDSELTHFKDRFCDYYDYIHTHSDFSLEVSETSIDRSCASFDDHLDSGFANLEAGETSRTDTLTKLELKVVKLGDILQEQHHLLQELKEEIVNLETLIINKTNQTAENTEGLFSVPDNNTNNSKILLEAIELKHEQRFEVDLKNVLKEFLKSDDLKNHLAVTAVEQIREGVNQCLTETFRQVYLPFLERSHRRLLTHVSRTLHNAFHELEENRYFLYKSVHKSTRNLRYEIERHQTLLESSKPDLVFQYLQSNLETVLRTELIEWSNKLLTVLKPQEFEETFHEDKFNDEESTINLNSPSSPPQPADPERSIIDQLMKSAQINKEIQNGEINKAFEMALSSEDLSLVMAACRAARPRHVFDPCVLKQPVMLALIQQLATDMVHDTQLKCRYLEDALIKLDLSNQATREHLPLIVGELRKHLTKFLHFYPSHVASRRITLIIMVADNLLNKRAL